MNKKLYLYDPYSQKSMDVTQECFEKILEIVGESAYSLSSATYVLLNKLYEINLEQDKQIRYLIDTCKSLQAQISMIDDPDNVNGSW